MIQIPDAELRFILFPEGIIVTRRNSSPVFVGITSLGKVFTDSAAQAVLPKTEKIADIASENLLMLPFP
jgi:glucosamine 6-phosphate synthetase-like amidotransferase/phosphosugar isomerase protein